MKKQLLILTGFLGSGKTTLLCRLLQAEPAVPTAVLLNDFGQIPVDGALVEKRDGMELVEIGGGSVFCACLKAQFIQALAGLARRDVARVLVEASGMSDPAGLARTLELAGLSPSFERPRVFCLFDPFKSLKLSHVLEVIPRQIQAADRICIGKPGCGGPEARQAAAARVLELRPDAPLCDPADDDALTRLALELLPPLPQRGEAAAGQDAGRPRRPGDAHGSSEAYGSGEALSPGFNTPETRPDSFVIRRAPQGRTALLAALAQAPEVLRVKGHLEDAAGTVFVSDTGQGFAQSPARTGHEQIPLVVICLQGSGAALEHRLRERALAE